MSERLLTDEDRVYIDAVADCCYPGESWETIRSEIADVARHFKKAQLDANQRVAIQRLWCQHCKALQKSNDTVVECLYNQLEHGREDAFCSANVDAVSHIVALLPSVREERERIRQKLWDDLAVLISQVSFSNTANSIWLCKELAPIMDALKEETP